MFYNLFAFLIFIVSIDTKVLADDVKESSFVNKVMPVVRDMQPLAPQLTSTPNAPGEPDEIATGESGVEESDGREEGPNGSLQEDTEELDGSNEINVQNMSGKPRIKIKKDENKTKTQTQNDSNDTVKMKRELAKLYESNYKEINHIANYVGFGILIAIFSMSRGFRSKNKCHIILCMCLAAFSLVVNYIVCWYLLAKSESLLLRNSPEMNALYNDLSCISSNFLMLISIILLAAVIAFGLLTYNYFFKNEEND